MHAGKATKLLINEQLIAPGAFASVRSRGGVHTELKAGGSDVKSSRALNCIPSPEHGHRGTAARGEQELGREGAGSRLGGASWGPLGAAEVLPCSRNVEPWCARPLANTGPYPDVVGWVGDPSLGLCQGVPHGQPAPGCLGVRPSVGGVGEVFTQNRVCNSFGAITGASNIGWAAVLVSERPHQ